MTSKSEKTPAPTSASTKNKLKNFSSRIDSLFSMPLPFVFTGIPSLLGAPLLGIGFLVYLSIFITDKSNQIQLAPMPVPVPVQEKAVLPVALPADADESVKLHVPSAVATKQPISEGSIEVPSIPLLPQPLSQPSRVDYGQLVERVQKKSLAKPVQLVEQKQADVASEDDGTGVHVELRNTQTQPVSEVAAEDDAVKVKIEPKKAGATNENKNSEALPLEEKVSPEYKILQETENGVLIRQGNKVNLIRFGDKLPDGNKAGKNEL